MKTLHRFRKKDYFVVCILLLGALSVAAVMIVATPDLLFSLLGKDATLTGRTGIWSAVIDSIAKRPLLGYGYQAFWLAPGRRILSRDSRCFVGPGAGTERLS